MAVVGPDLTKRSFPANALDAKGTGRFSKQLTRARLVETLSHRPACTVALEACASAHHWARRSRAAGHEVRLIAPQFVKPFVKSNTNAGADAGAICEAARRPGIRFVAVKRVERPDIQAIARRRSLAAARRRSTRFAGCCSRMASRSPSDEGCSYAL